ncbi:reverse transcriptase domain-containing protein [Tanacetum coccineum]
MKGHHLLMIKDRQFDVHARADLQKHIAEFIEIYAKVSFNELSPGVITTWEEMRQAFVSRFFPPAMFERLIGEIRGFAQHPNESLVDAWSYDRTFTLVVVHRHGFRMWKPLSISSTMGLEKATQSYP